MIPQKTDEVHEKIKIIMQDMPVIYTDNRSCLYFLARELSDELVAFLSTGITTASELRVFSEEQEKALIRLWTDAGLTIKYHRQQMEYMHHQVAIVYPQISNSTTSMSVSLIPWFMLPKRPYPVFVYLYAIWHYHNTAQESQQRSAKAARKLFGISSLNKSTVCRSIKAMRDFLNLSQIDRPLSGEDPETASDEEMINHIPEILRDCPSIKLLEEIYGDKVRRLPEPVNRRDSITCSQALNGIPQEYAEVIKEGGQSSGKPRDARVRPTRPHKKGVKRVQRILKFVEPQQIEHIRIEFINICRRFVLDAAITYHRFLL